MHNPPLHDIQVLAFDVFGTVVDWCQSIADEVQALRPDIHGLAFARAWRAGYQPAMQRVRSGQLPWTRIDDLHRIILDGILDDFNMADLDEAARQHLNLAWHRLQPWPDVLQGLQALKKRHLITTLSNGNISLLTHMAKAAGLPWDCVLSAEVFRAYKPDAAVYRGVAEVFAVRPEQVMLVAAHHDDLEGARSASLLTAYIERPFEFGHDQPKDVSPRAANTLHATSFPDLARQLPAAGAAGP